jgi:chromosome segregation ATPase
MALDAHQVQEGISVAQAIGGLFTGLGVWEGVKAGLSWLAARRQAKRKADADALKQAEDTGAAKVQHSREARQDAVGEWKAIAAERKQEMHDCHERLDAAEKRANDQQAEIDECKEDRRALRSKVDALEGRVLTMENSGHG